MGGYSGGQGNSLQNSSAASAEAESAADSRNTTGGKVFNVTNYGASGPVPWEKIGLAVLVLFALALAWRKWGKG